MPTSSWGNSVNSKGQPGDRDPARGAFGSLGLSILEDGEEGEENGTLNGGAGGLGSAVI